MKEPITFGLTEQDFSPAWFGEAWGVL